MTAVDMNARTNQSKDDVSFIETIFLPNRNVALRSYCDVKQQRCHRGFTLYQPCSPGVRGDENRKTVLKSTSRVRLKAKNSVAGGGVVLPSISLSQY